jgi:CubicO group peptidase (beta-lactamase class C family)
MHKRLPLLSLLALILCVSCSAPRTGIVADEGRVHQPLKQGDWVTHGLSEKSRDSLKIHLRKGVRSEMIAGGSLLLLHRGEVIFDDSFGYADKKSGRHFRTNEVCRLASISKPILATVMVRLAARGVVDLDATIDTYLPEWKSPKLMDGGTASRAPTVAELLWHTAGMPPFSKPGGKPWLKKWTRQPGVTLEQVVKRYAENGLAWEPGIKYAYSGVGTDVAARVAEVASGIPRDELLLQELSKPLGLSTLTYLPDEQTLRSLPTYYTRTLTELRTSSHYVTAKRPRPAGQYSSSGGGVVSSPRDLAVWLMMYRNLGMHEGREYISDAWLRRMFQPAPNAPKRVLGFGIAPGDKPGYPSRISHSGSTGTYCWVDYDRDVIGVLFTQTARTRIGKRPPSFIGPVRKMVDEIFDNRMEK